MSFVNAVTIPRPTLSNVPGGEDKKPLCSYKHGHECRFAVLCRFWLQCSPTLIQTILYSSMQCPVHMLYKHVFNVIFVRSVSIWAYPPHIQTTSPAPKLCTKFLLPIRAIVMSNSSKHCSIYLRYFAAPLQLIPLSCSLLYHLVSSNSA